MAAPVAPRPPDPSTGDPSTGERVVDLDRAVDAIPDGARVYLGGAVLHRKPIALVRRLVERDRRGLDLVTFAGSLDVDLLVGAGAANRVSSAYVGLGGHGSAPRFSAASSSGEIVDVEFSEWTMLQGLRAAATGTPFVPTRAGAGSEVVEALGLRHVTDPYDGRRYLAVPPLRPDVALLHAWRASPAGDVQFGWPPEHLWDVDVLAARAARTVVVTVDEVVSAETVAAEPQLTRLFGFEVDLVVPAPGGAWPTASPPGWPGDDAAVARYRESGGDPATLAVGAAR